jgi:hypothetical protein
MAETDWYRGVLAHNRGGEIEKLLHRRGETAVRELSA